MSQILKETISVVCQVRTQLGTLHPEDQDTLVKIGAELETILGQIPEDLEQVHSTVGVCLEALQAIFHGDVRSYPALITVLTATMVALEQVLAAPTSPVTGGMLNHTMSLLQAELAGGSGGPVSGVAETEAPETAVPDLSTLDDIATFLIQVETDDRTGLTLIFEALKVISEQEEAADTRKLLVKAARDINRILAGKAADAGEILNSVGNLIDQVNGTPANTESAADAPVAEKTGRSIVAAATPVSPTSESRTESAVRGASDFEPDTLAADSDLDLVKEFVIESREMLEAAESALLALETDLENIENVNTVFRAFHTIKGTGAYLGFKRLTELAHLAESLLSRMRDREIQCTGGYADLALRSTDTIKEMLDSTESALAGTPMTLPNGYGDLISILTDPEMAGISGSAFDTSQMDEHGLTEESDLSEAASGALAAQIIPERRGPVEDRRSAADRAADTSVRVRTDRLDRLIDIVGELVIAQSMLTQDATVMQGIHHELSRKISHAGKIVRELQDLSMGMRMIPLKGTFQKMARLVRDVAQKCGKQVEFITEGEDTEIDRNMVDLIADPLVHMVRNAVDHGIELPDRRETAGKSRTGKITLAAYHAGGDVVVELADDGNGLDRDVLVAKAIAKNLIETDKGLSESEIFNLIFAPGFSTAAEVTAVSGRGVGMDVVRRNIEAMRGRVTISSEKGKGSVFTVRLPLTLAITDGMLIRVGSERFIIPIVNIQLSFQPTPAMLSSVTGRGELVSLRGELMPVFRLHRLFKVTDSIEDPTRGLLMIVADGRRRCALLVDELLGQQQVVAKNLGQGMGKIQGVSGGAILGDGCIGLILDTPELVAMARQNGNAAERKETIPQLVAA